MTITELQSIAAVTGLPLETVRRIESRLLAKAASRVKRILAPRTKNQN